MTVVTEAPFSVVDLVDEHVAALEEPRPPDGKWHPSSYWGCDRKVIYEVRGTERSDPPGKQSMRVFRIGHILHAFVQEGLMSAPGIRCYPEFGIETKLLEAGHGDALVEVLDTGMWIVVEIKSQKAASFRYGLNEGHAKQVSSYAVAARNEGVWVDDPAAPDGKRFMPALGEKLVGVLVAYFEKESLRTAEFWLPYDTAWETRVQERIAHLETYRADPESLPPRQANKSKFPCSWNGGQCDFFRKCWEQDGAGVKPAEPSAVPDAFEW